MTGKKTLKEIRVKDHSQYYLGNVIDINDLILKNIIIDKITLKNIIYHVRYDASYTVKLLYIAFQKID